MYMQVAACIRNAIADGEYSAGARLPSRSRLAEHFQVAPMTVQNALRLLGDEGVIVSRQGSGVYVRHVVPGGPSDLIAEIDDLRERLSRLERLFAERVDRDLA
jgi:DNA-binding GntR family transcriptional regulator